MKHQTALQFIEDMAPMSMRELRILIYERFVPKEPAQPYAPEAFELPRKGVRVETHSRDAGLDHRVLAEVLANFREDLTFATTDPKRLEWGVCLRQPNGMAIFGADLETGVESCAVAFRESLCTELANARWTQYGVHLFDTGRSYHVYLDQVGRSSDLEEWFDILSRADREGVLCQKWMERAKKPDSDPVLRVSPKWHSGEQRKTHWGLTLNFVPNALCP